MLPVVLQPAARGVSLVIVVVLSVMYIADDGRKSRKRLRVCRQCRGLLAEETIVVAFSGRYAEA